MHVFAWIWNKIRFHIYMSPVDAYKATKHMKPSNLGLCFNSTMDIALSAQYANLNSRWLTRVLYSTFDGFHNVWTSHVAFDRLPESLTSIIACLKSTPVGTGEQVLKVFILLATGTLLGMIGFIVVVFDKLSSLRAEIEPVVNELIDRLTACFVWVCHATISNESQAMWHHCWSLHLYLA
jgi:hypothetical protein